MATIKIRRGTTDPITLAPGGVTSGEPIFNTALNKLFVHNGTTGIWVGAEVDNGTGLGSSQTKIPTQYAVKTYVDNNLASGAVTSINGVTGAASLRAGTGISVTPGTDPDKGITITNIGVQSAVGGTGISVSGATGAVTFTNTGVQSLNGSTGAVTNVARINEGNTFSVKQVMLAGITTSQLNVAGIAVFGYAPNLNSATGEISFEGTTATFASTATVVSSASGRLIVGSIDSPDVNPIGALRLLGFGQSGGGDYQYTNDITPIAHGTQTANLTHTLPSTTGTLLNSNSAVTSAVGGTGISVSGATGAVTFTNTGVQSAVAGNQITVSGATGAVTIGVTANPSFTTITTSGNGTVGGNLTVTGNLTINGTSTTVNSNTMTVDDPLIIIGTSGGQPLSVTDGGKDRGIVFNYYDTAGRTGFFGWDANENEFAFQQSSTVTNEIVAGVTYGNVHVANLRLQNGAVIDTIVGSTSGSQTHQFRNYGGLIVNSNAEPTTGYILRGNSTGSHTWQDPTASGFTAFAATRLATARNIALTGDVTGTVSFDGTAGVTISTTIAASSVVLGTDTTGAYAEGVSVAGIGLTLVGAVNNGTVYTITSGATSANSPSQIVARDASGNFTAGTITATSFVGNASTATSAATLTTSRLIALGGDLSGSALFNGSAGITITAAIVANSVELGTDTTGNYVSNIIVSGTGLSISGVSGEGTTFTITSGATSANSPSQIVARDASGNFTAGTITASSFVGTVTGNVSGSAATLTTARLIALGGDLSGSANFDGSAGITITAAIVTGSIVDADIASATITDSKLATIFTADKVSLSALNIDGGTAAGNIAGIDLLIVDNGANGTNRKVTVNNLFGSSSTAVIDGGSY